MCLPLPAYVCPLMCLPICVCVQVLAENSGLDAQESLIQLQEEHERGNAAGLDVTTGEPFQPDMAGVFDNYIVKKQVGWVLKCTALSQRVFGALHIVMALPSGRTQTTQRVRLYVVTDVSRSSVLCLSYRTVREEGCRQRHILVDLQSIYALSEYCALPRFDPCHNNRLRDSQCRV